VVVGGRRTYPFPFVDLVAVSDVQLKMLTAVSKTYGVECEEARGKTQVASSSAMWFPNVLSFGSVTILLKAIPVVGQLVGAPSMGIFCGASAYAVGKVFVQHFEAEGTFLIFHTANVKEYFKKGLMRAANCLRRFKSQYA
jgi:uncharacterized protein (DUF697 family)